MDPLDKIELRRSFLAQRDGIAPSATQASSLQMLQYLVIWLRARQTRQLLLFYPMRNEPDLAMLTVLLPEVKTALPVVGPCRAMNFYGWRSGEPLTAGPFGTKEPEHRGVLVTPDATTVILVPCLAVDQHGTRLGYGGGYYDQYLAKCPEATVVGVVLSPFAVKELPREGHDQPLGWIVTEQGLTQLSP